MRAKVTQMWIMAMLMIVLALMSVGEVMAIGIAPGHSDITFEPNGMHTVRVKILNNDRQNFQAVLYAEGELAQYISFDQPVVSFTSSEAEKIVTYTLKLPSSFAKQGLHTSDIVARAVPTESGGQGVGMSASVAVVSKLNVMVPYSGKYAEITLFTPNFELGKEGNFAVEVKNLGTEDIIKGTVLIDIYSPSNQKVAALTGDTFQLASKGRTVATVRWNPDIGAGTYRAVATLIYDSENTKDERQFSIGDFTVEITDITVKDFSLGGIAMFDIMLENRWNERIPGIYADVSVKDEGGKTYTQFKTASIDLNEREKESVQAYWDTKSVGPGEYKLDVTLNFLGQKAQKVFDIVVSTDKIETFGTGLAIGDTGGSDKEPILQGIYVLTFLVIVLIIFNVVMFLKKGKGERGNTAIGKAAGAIGSAMRPLKPIISKKK